MKINKVFNSVFLIFFGFTFLIGVLPLVLYPFSAYFQEQNEYSEENHGPLHQYPNGDYYESAPQGVDWFISISLLYLMLMVLIVSLIAFIYHLRPKKIKLDCLFDSSHIECCIVLLSIQIALLAI
jgi:hypothetical protein